MGARPSASVSDSRSGRPGSSLTPIVPGDRRQDERRVAHAIERDERDPPVPCPEVARRELRREAALPHPADAREREERRPSVADEAAQLRELRVAADEGRRRALGRGGRPAGLDVCCRGLGGAVSRRVHRGSEHTPGTGTAGCG